VVLTPAVYAAIKKAKTDRAAVSSDLAFIANAANLVLPFEPREPGGLRNELAPIASRLRVFYCPLSAPSPPLHRVALGSSGRNCRDTSNMAANREAIQSGHRAICGIIATGAVLIVASAIGVDLGLPRASRVIAVLIATGARPHAVQEVAKGVSWSVYPSSPVSSFWLRRSTGPRVNGRWSFLQTCASMRAF